MKPQIEESLKKMSVILKEMIDLIYQGLMKNDEYYFNSALNKERAVDELEKTITADIVECSKQADEAATAALVTIGQVALNLERIGDELRYLMERIEIKIAENLYFSDEGVAQYKEVFSKMQKSVDGVVDFLNTRNENLLDQVLSNGLEIKDMIEQYRVKHMERVTRGICQAMAANIFFDMLDFTGNAARHCTNIAKLYKGK